MTTGMKREKEIEHEILHALNLRPGTLAWKYEVAGVFDAVKGVRFNRGRFVFKGAADVQGVDAAGFFAIEVKTDKGRLSPEQKGFIKRIRMLGQRAGVARSLDEAIKIIEGKTDNDSDFGI